MEAVRQWAICLLASAIAGAFACIVMPNGSVEKTVKAVSGIFVIAAVCSPLADLDTSEFAQAITQAAAVEYSIQTQTLKEGTLDMYDTAIREAIIGVAETCDVCVREITTKLDISDNCIIIHNVTADLEDGENDKTEKFRAEVREKLGFSIEIISRQER